MREPLVLQIVERLRNRNGGHLLVLLFQSELATRGSQE
jgi:hypothetical protein